MRWPKWPLALNMEMGLSENWQCALSLSWRTRATSTTSPKWLLASSMKMGLSELAGCTLSQLAENSDQHAITEWPLAMSIKVCLSEN